MTQQQAWLLRRSSEQIILSFDSDDAGITAKMRAIDILQDMGCDIRLLEMEGAKDPDEYIVKYGNSRFHNLIEKAISIIEFKVKVLKQKLNLENVNDKIKFLNEIAKLISKIDNIMEREVYIEKISKKYDISKEAIHAEVNKLTYVASKNQKILEKNKPVIKQMKNEERKVSKDLLKRENTIIAILLIGDVNIFKIIQGNINIEDVKDEVNKKILKKLYEEYENGNSNINSVLDKMKEEEQNRITSIMSEDYELENIEKAIDDIMRTYEKEKLKDKKNQILELIENTFEEAEKNKLEKELSEIIVKLAKIK